LKAKQAALALSASALVIIVVGCFASQLYQQHNFKYTLTGENRVPTLQVSSIAGLNAVGINQYILMAVPSTLTMQTTTPSQTYLLNNTRSQIYDFISQNPGVQFRAVAAGLCLPVGLAEYHLGVLVRAGLLSFVRDGRYKRFFVSKRFNKREMTLICLLRHKTAKRIFETLLCKHKLSHCKLADEVAISSQALTWQMKTLRNTRYILEVNNGTKTIYSLNEESTPTLVKYLAVVT
jgi:predicted transcriptional regulator